MVFPYSDGSYPAGAVPVLEAQMANGRDALWERIKELRDSYEVGGTETPLGRMDTDPDSQRKINGLVTMAMLAMQSGQPFSQPFTMADNSIVDHDAAQMIAAGIAVGQHVSAVHAVSQAFRDALDAATTLEELEAIDVTTGWPN